VFEEFPVATHFTAFNPIKAKYSFHSISGLQWKLLVEEEGLNGYSWYRQYTLKIHSQDVGDMVARGQDGQTLRH